MNMNPQYRAELRELNQARKKILRDAKAYDRGLWRERRLAAKHYTAATRLAQSEFDIQMNAIQRVEQKSKRSVEKQTSRISNRIAILEGRLS